MVCRGVVRRMELWVFLMRGEGGDRWRGVSGLCMMGL